MIRGWLDMMDDIIRFFDLEIFIKKYILFVIVIFFVFFVCMLVMLLLE